MTGSARNAPSGTVQGRSVLAPQATMTAAIA